MSREVPGYTPSGGIGTYAQILAGALARKGVDAHLLCVYPGLARSTRDLGGATLHTAPQLQPRGVGRLSHMPATMGRLAQAASVFRELRRLRIGFDVVEAPELNAEALFVAMRADVPVVVRLHSSVGQLIEHSGGHVDIDAKAAMSLEHAAIRRAQIVVSTRSNIGCQAPALRLNPAFTRAIIYPVLVRDPTPPPPLAHPRVLFVGRLEPRKGPEMLVRAAPAVLETHPTARFRFVGDDTATAAIRSYRAHLQELATQLGVGPAIEFAGPCDHEQVFAEMAAAAVCAFPSRWESFGLVVAEAASIARPVVVSAIPAFQDYVTHDVTGRVVPLDDLPSWSTALSDAITTPERTQRMGLRLRDEVAHRADPSHVADLAIESYEAAIARSKTLS